MCTHAIRTIPSTRIQNNGGLIFCSRQMPGHIARKYLEIRLGPGGQAP